MFFGSPQDGLTPALRCVTCFQSPTGPAQISGGALNELRATAEDFASRETERLGPQRPAESASLLRQSWRTCALAGSSEATAESPPRYSAKRILPSAVQENQLAEPFRSGVRFCAELPVAGTMAMSPPTEGSSLIKPSMKSRR